MFRSLRFLNRALSPSLVAMLLEENRHRSTRKHRVLFDARKLRFQSLAESTDSMREPAASQRLQLSRPLIPADLGSHPCQLVRDNVVERHASRTQLRFPMLLRAWMDRRADRYWQALPAETTTWDHFCRHNVSSWHLECLALVRSQAYSG